MNDSYDLARFVTAQDLDGTYERAVAELRRGQEAEAYLRHPVLGPRLLACAQLVVDTENRTVVQIFGSIDALKLRSSMTLFLRATPTEPLFQQVLRVRPTAALKVEMAAWAAASSVLPTPEVMDLVELEVASAALVRRLPGTAAGAVGPLTPERARKRGQACGQVRGLLSSVVAPAVVPPAPGRAARPRATAPPAGDRLLHLDLHPFDVLVDEVDAVSGVIDWANVAAGQPDLDRARSASILALDPAAVARQAEPRWAALTKGWVESGQLGDVPAWAMAWACHFMLNDLLSRYSGDQLAGVYKALSDLDRWAPASDLARDLRDTDDDGERTRGC